VSSSARSATSREGGTDASSSPKVAGSITTTSTSACLAPAEASSANPWQANSSRAPESPR
jgi:hypothetical protein